MEKTNLGSEKYWSNKYACLGSWEIDSPNVKLQTEINVSGGWDASQRECTKLNEKPFFRKNKKDVEKLSFQDSSYLKLGRRRRV